MKIKINKIILENYKCFDSIKEFDFLEKTRISGKNRAGKSTVRDSYYDVLTGKMSDGTTPDKIRPHDGNGVDIDKVDIVREVHLEIEGKPTIIRKRTFQKWRKPRGQAKEVFDGNGVDYEIDGFAYKPKQFEEYMAKIINPDTLMMCSNATPFLTTLRKSTSDARKLLEKLAGFSTEQFISENSEYSHIAEITKGHSVEDTLKKLRKQLSEQKKKLDEQNTKIKYEKTRSLDTPHIEVADLELAKVEWKDKLEDIGRHEQALEESIKVYDELVQLIRELKKSMNELYQKAYSEIKYKKSKVRDSLNEAERRRKNLSNDLRNAEMDLQIYEKSIQRYSADLKRAQEDYITYSKTDFDESKIHEIESEQFNEEALVCPTCGQTLPEIQAQKIRIDFEESKSRRIQAEQLKKKQFESDVENNLSSITEDGNKAQEGLKKAKSDKDSAEQRIEQIKKEISEVSIEIEHLKAEIASIPDEVDMYGNQEYNALKNQIDEKETELSALDNGSSRRSELRQKRNEYMAEIAKIDSQIQKANADEEEKVMRLQKLESDLRDMSQVAADIEKEIDLVGDFSRKKNEALANAINQHFHHFQFSFLEWTIEGNPVETCRLIVDGTDYFGGLNHGDRILVECDLVAGLQEMNGISIPIWIDDCESLDPDRIPDLNQQLIILCRSDDRELKVEEMK